MSKLLVEEKPFATAVARHAVSEVCSFCFKTSPDLKPCRHCDCAYYCSLNCRNADRDDHAVECELMDLHYMLYCAEEDDDEDTDDDSRMTAIDFMPDMNVRLVLRIYQKWKLRRDLGEQAPFGRRNIQDVPTHVDRWRGESALFRRRFDNMFRLLCAFTDSGLACPTREIAMQIYAMLCTSGRVIETYDLTCAGVGLYVGLSAHETACTPDAFVISNGRMAQIRTPNTSLTYSPKLTVDSRPYPLRESKASWNYDMTWLECDCGSCLDDRSIRMSARCSNPHCDGVCPLTMTNGGRHSKLACNRCHRPCNHTFSQVLEANQRAQLFFDATDSFQNPDDWLQSALKMSGRLSPILSNLNVRMSKLSLHLFTGLLRLSDDSADLLVEFAQRMVVCFRRILPRGHPLRALSVYAVPYAKTRRRSCPASQTRIQKQTLAQFKEARIETQLAFGLDHPFYVNGVRLRTWPLPETNYDDEDDEDDDDSGPLQFVDDDEW